MAEARCNWCKEAECAPGAVLALFKNWEPQSALVRSAACSPDGEDLRQILEWLQPRDPEGSKPGIVHALYLHTGVASSFLCLAAWQRGLSKCVDEVHGNLVPLREVIVGHAPVPGPG